MIYQKIIQKIRHFLLQNSPTYQRSLLKNKAKPSINQLAKSLSKEFSIGERRMQKYLSENTSEKDLRFNLDDVYQMSLKSSLSLGEFVSYLNDEKTRNLPLRKYQEETLRFFEQINMGLRRELNLCLFQREVHEEEELILNVWMTTITLTA